MSTKEVKFVDKVIQIVDERSQVDETDPQPTQEIGGIIPKVVSRKRMIIHLFQILKYQSQEQ